jgi:hypothetical protein
MAAITSPRRSNGSKGRVKESYKTSYGRMIHGRIEDALEVDPLKSLAGSVNLIITSPPFPLVHKKRYGNETGQAYLSWLESLALRFADLLTDDGSIVIEIGNAWEEGFLFGRGTYGLRKHIPVKGDQLEQVAEAAEDMIADSALDRQWHASEILAGIAERNPNITSNVDKYVLDIALQTSGNLQSLGRLMWRQRGADSDATRIEVRQAVTAIVKSAGKPLRARDIRQRLVALRGMGQYFQLGPLDPLIRVGPATWGLNDRDVAIKREQQPSFSDWLSMELQRLGQGVHISEIADLLGDVYMVSPEAAFSLATLDERFSVNTGQYLYLKLWGESRRTSTKDAVEAILRRHPAGIQYEELVSSVHREIGRQCERSAVAGSLRAIGAISRGNGYWALDADSDGMEEQEPQVA